MSDWRNSFERELEHARMARQSGNEGRARVCARRAAGIAAGEFLLRQGSTNIPASAYDRLVSTNQLIQVNPETKLMIEHLLMPVNSEHNLPVPIDLIAEAIRLVLDLGLE